MCNNKKRRERLWKDQKNCYWCGVLTHDPNLEGTPKRQRATLDHIVSRNHQFRSQYSSYVVIACYYCNNLRSRIEIENMSYGDLLKIIRKGRRPHAEKIFRSCISPIEFIYCTN